MDARLRRASGPRSFLCFNLLAPGEWPFPNPRPPLACTPNRLQPGATLTLRMQVPHGSQLAVFTPKRGAVVLIPYGVKQFQYAPLLTLSTDTLSHIFADPGVYIITISSEAELSASLVCRVRYAGSAPIAS